MQYTRGAEVSLSLWGLAGFGLGPCGIVVPDRSTRRNRIRCDQVNGEGDWLRPVERLDASCLSMPWYVALATFESTYPLLNPPRTALSTPCQRIRRGACRAPLANDQHYRASEAASTGCLDVCLWSPIIIHHFGRIFLRIQLKVSKSRLRLDGDDQN
jgi:hypothetical protein